MAFDETRAGCAVSLDTFGAGELVPDPSLETHGGVAVLATSARVVEVAVGAVSGTNATGATSDEALGEAV